ncbi:MAG: MTH1187 family thiamine-binding protein [Nitrospiraceae bacterium]|nr:MTH1187 family thiamine-binding protein [Nitrospiraceae bacterium]
MLAEFSIIPVGTGESLSGQVSQVLGIIDESGLPYRLNPMGTVVEGEWDEVMRLIRKCHRAAMKHTGRCVLRIDIDDRKGKKGRMEQKISSVEKKLGRKLKK